MTPNLTSILAQTHMEELRRSAEHRSGVDAHARRTLRRAPTRQVIHRTRHLPVASHH